MRWGASGEEGVKGRTHGGGGNTSGASKDDLGRGLCSAGLWALCSEGSVSLRERERECVCVCVCVSLSLSLCMSLHPSVCAPKCVCCLLF